MRASGEAGLNARRTELARRIARLAPNSRLRARLEQRQAELTRAVLALSMGQGGGPEETGPLAEAEPEDRTRWWDR